MMIRATLATLCGFAVLSAGLIVSTGCHMDSNNAGGRPAGSDKYVQAMMAYQSGNRDAAVEEFLAALRDNPDLRMAHSMLGDIYRGENKWSAALPHYEAVARLDPYTLANHYNLGLTFQMLDRVKEAIPSYERALELNPNDLKTNMNLGLAYLALGRLDEAVEKLEKATRLAPNDAQAWSNLGVALDSRGSTVLAESAYRKSLELDSHSIATLANLSANLVTQGKGSEAVAVGEEVLKRADTVANHKRYGDALASAKHFDDAMKQYAIALSRDPRYTPAMNSRADVLLKQYRASLELDEPKLDDAIKQFHESLKINPDQPKIVAQVKELEKPALFGK